MDGLTTRFAVDCSVICNAEFSVAFQCHAGDLGKLKSALLRAYTAIAFWYTGNHKNNVENNPLFARGVNLIGLHQKLVFLASIKTSKLKTL